MKYVMLRSQKNFKGEIQCQKIKIKIKTKTKADPKVRSRAKAAAAKKAAVEAAKKAGGTVNS
jgi:hypothetical protein